jgi:hypothetical protein
MEIIIKIGDEDWMLRGAELSFELCRQRNRRDKKTGEVVRVWEAEKWYSNPESVFQNLLNMKLRAAEANTLSELKNQIESIRVELMEHYSTEFELSKAA